MATNGEADVEATFERKRAVRKEVRAALRGMSESEMAAQSSSIAARILDALPFVFKRPIMMDVEPSASGQPPLKKVKVALYVHCAKLREVDTGGVLRAALALPHVRVYVPIVDEAKAEDDAEKEKAPSMRFLRIQSMEADLEPKCMGIMEPTELEADGTPRENLESEEADAWGGPLDLLLMPGLAFDEAGNRCGRGGGFYDAFIERYEARCDARGWARPTTLALAYSAQVLPAGGVPMGSHDKPVDALATHEGLVGCTEAGRRLLGGSLR